MPHDPSPGTAAAALPPETVENMRALNRIVTRASGVLSRTAPDGDMSLTEMRILHELGLATWTARQLARHLALDEGHVSRVLKRFAAQGWLRRTASPEDGRVALLELTETGAARRAAHEEVARRQVRDSLAGLSDAERPALDRAIARVRTALGDPGLAASAITIRDMAPGDLGWLIQRHAELYRIEAGFDASFERLVAEVLVEYLKTRDPARERAFIPVRDGLPLGSVFCVQGPAPDMAQLRLFWLEPSLRGTGLGRRMLADWLGFARAVGYRRAALWTHESHAAAGRLYAAAGFEITGTKPTRNFGRDVVEQRWEMTL